MLLTVQCQVFFQEIGPGKHLQANPTKPKHLSRMRLQMPLEVAPADIRLLAHLANERPVIGVLSFVRLQTRFGLKGLVAGGAAVRPQVHVDLDDVTLQQTAAAEGSVAQFAHRRVFW